MSLMLALASTLNTIESAFQRAIAFCNARNLLALDALNNHRISPYWHDVILHSLSYKSLYPRLLEMLYHLVETRQGHLASSFLGCILTRFPKFSLPRDLEHIIPWNRSKCEELALLIRHTVDRSAVLYFTTMRDDFQPGRAISLAWEWSRVLDNGKSPAEDWDNYWRCAKIAELVRQVFPFVQIPSFVRAWPYLRQ